MRRIDELLTEAAYDGDAEQIASLLNRGANPNCRSSNGFTPLHWVAFQSCVGHSPLEAARRLIAAGAELTSFTQDCLMTPLSIACDMGHFKLAVLLVESGANVSTIADEENPLFCAVANSDTDIVHFLLQMGADPEHKDARGDDALSAALYENNEAILGLLKQFIRH